MPWGTVWPSLFIGWVTHYLVEVRVATLLSHADQIRAQFTSAFADKRISFSEVLQLVGVIVGAAACTLDKLQDKSQFGALVAEAEELYSSLLDPAKIDIPKVPEWLEGYVVDIGKQAIRPMLEKIADALDGVQ